MKIHCLGGCREVGRNAILLQDKENIVFDYGVKVETAELPIIPNKVDAILLTHAHLDHCGGIPALFRRMNPSVIGTVSTFDQAELILRDSMKVCRLKGFPENYTTKDIEKMKDQRELVTYGQKFEMRNSKIDILDAGHIAGSTMFVVNTGGKRIMYTGDFNTGNSQLLSGSRVNIKNIDVLITESTYAAKDHSPRKETEENFFRTVKDTINNGGTAIIASFAVGRAAELLMILEKFKPKFKIYLDGMAKKATEMALRYPEFLRDPKALARAYKRVILINNFQDRKKALKEPAAIVTTGGCIDGGPAVFYIKNLYQRPECSLILTGFQIPKTAGRYLLDTGRYVVEGLDLKLKMKIETFDFSGHSGREELFNSVNKINPGKVICIHGDNCQRFAQELKGRGFDAVAPKNGDILKIS